MRVLPLLLSVTTSFALSFDLVSVNGCNDSESRTSEVSSASTVFISLERTSDDATELMDIGEKVFESGKYGLLVFINHSHSGSQTNKLKSLVLMKYKFLIEFV